MNALHWLKEVAGRLFGRSPSQLTAPRLDLRLFLREYMPEPSKILPVRMDQSLAFAAFVLLALGLLFVYSASIVLPDSPKYAKYSSEYFLIRHGFSVGLGIAAALVALHIPSDWYEKAAPWLFLAALAALFLVLVPGVGKGVNGARRWLPLGVMNFQPSELMKLAIVVFASAYMVRKMEVRESFWLAVAPMALAVAFVGALLLAEPDMGAFLVIACIAMGVLFIGGVNARMFSLVAIILLTTFVVIIYASDWRRERIFAYLDPWNEKYSLGKGYQLSHSLIAFGRGEWFGVGLGNSVEKLHYLPEAHTDFILAIIGEELGFVGVLAVIAIFGFIVKRCIRIGRRCISLDRIFQGLCCQGIAVWLGVQAFINIGVTLGVLPTKGLTLPFMSYGGSAILMNCLALALVLRIDLENSQMMNPVREDPQPPGPANLETGKA